MSTAPALSLDHLLQRGPAILRDVARWRADGAPQLPGLVLETASLLRLEATLSLLSPVLEAELPQRVGRLYDVLHHSDDPALVALADRWASELEARGTVWLRSLRRPDAMPPDWPHRPLAGSNPRWAERAPVLGLDDGTSCHLQRMDDDARRTLPGRLVGLDAMGRAAVTQARGVVRCFDGELLRWEQRALGGLVIAARFHRDRVVLLGSGRVTVLDASDGARIAEHHAPGLRHLVGGSVVGGSSVEGEEVFVVGERTVHALEEGLPVRFEVGSAIGAVLASGERLFVSEVWKGLHAIDAASGAPHWTIAVKAQGAALALSPDGRKLAVGSAKSTEPIASIVDARDGGTRVDLVERGTATDVAFDGPGERLFVGGAVFEVSSGRRLGVLAGRGGPVTAVTVSADGQHLVARSPDGLCLFEGRGTLRPLDEARPAIRALVLGEQILTDGEDTGFERFSMDGARLEQRSDRLIGVIEGTVMVTTDGRDVMLTCRQGQVRWRHPLTARAWIPRGLDGLVLQGADSFEVRAADGALRIQRGGSVREGAGDGRMLVIDQGDQTELLDARDGSTLAGLGTGVVLVAAEGARVVVLRQRERWELSLLRGGPAWSVTLALPRAPDALRLIDDRVVLEVRHLELGTEIVEETRFAFDAATGDALGVERSASPSGPGARTAYHGELELQFFAGATTVLHRGAPIASLPSRLDLAMGPRGPLLVGPRGPAVYELRGRLRASES